jgi:hypothetical protein
VNGVSLHVGQHSTLNSGQSIESSEWC